MPKASTGYNILHLSHISEKSEYSAQYITCLYTSRIKNKSKAIPVAGHGGL
jgi:hypothetical protein